MILTILLQVAAAAGTNVNDIQFRTMDVVLITGAVIGGLTSFLVLRFQSVTNAKDLAAYITANDKVIADLKREFEKLEEVSGSFKKQFFDKMEKNSDELHKLTLGIEQFKNEILQQLNKK